MPDPTLHSGQCLCGATRFTARVAAAEMGACHCSICRRWSGGVFLAVSCTDLDVADDTTLGVYRSSDWGERCFCTTCGSTLVWRTRDGAHIAVSVQAFADPAAFRFTTQIFIDDKPPTYGFAEPTRNMTGAEVLAQFPPNGA